MKDSGKKRSKKRRRTRKRRLSLLLWLLVMIFAVGYETDEGAWDKEFTANSALIRTYTEEAGISAESAGFRYEALPEYAGNPYVEVNGNVPYFTEEEVISESFETYGELDALGRCTTSIACLSEDTMPAEEEERGRIGNIKPSGWVSAKYDCVEGKYVMNRCHCIGWQLSGENDNSCNLISGTRYLNLEMLVYENLVTDYIRETGNHVMYRVTPVFVEEELFCRGILMEGYSVEDEGAGISYCVFFYNVQPGIGFDYATGESWYTGEFLDTDSAAVCYENVSAESTDKVTGVSDLSLSKSLCFCRLRTA